MRLGIVTVAGWPGDGCNSVVVAIAGRQEEASFVRGRCGAVTGEHVELTHTNELQTLFLLTYYARSWLAIHSITGNLCRAVPYHQFWVHYS